MREETKVGWKNYIFWSFKFVLLTRYLGNKPRVVGQVIKFKGFLDQLNNYQLFKDSSPLMLIMVLSASMHSNIKI